MIKAIITDVDGVIVGDNHGVNFPLPNKEVIQRLKELHQKGLPIILCTGKYKSGILELVEKTQLSNPHITDGGAIIINPLENSIIKKHVMGKNVAEYIVNNFLEKNIYLSVYGIDNYFVQKNTVCELTKKHALILQQEPELVKSLFDEIRRMDVVKIILYANNEKEQELINSLLNKINDKIHILWTLHPTLLPTKVCIVTLNGVSKKVAAEEVLAYLNISFEETLGIGDTLGDWKFMQHCKYVGTVGEIDAEFKQLIMSKGEGNYFLAPSVDENGFLKILDYFIK